jgi:hypothetical protein
MLAHAQHRPQQRRHDSKHNHWHAQKNAPPEEAEQNAREDQNRGCDEAEVQTAKCAARRMMLVLAWVYFMHNRRSAMRAEGPRYSKMSSAF